MELNKSITMIEDTFFLFYDVKVKKGIVIHDAMIVSHDMAIQI